MYYIGHKIRNEHFRTSDLVFERVMRLFFCLFNALFLIANQKKSSSLLFSNSILKFSENNAVLFEIQKVKQSNYDTLTFTLDCYSIFETRYSYIYTY